MTSVICLNKLLQQYVRRMKLRSVNSESRGLQYLSKFNMKINKKMLQLNFEVLSKYLKQITDTAKRMPALQSTVTVTKTHIL